MLASASAGEPGDRLNLDDARAVLSVDAEASKKEMRRAYLRLVRKHKPDRDPEGFKRVREAYELARASGPMEPVRIPIDSSFAPPPEEAPADPSAPAPGDSSALPVAPPVPVDYPDWLRDLDEELSTLSPEDGATRIREVIETHADHTELRYRLVDLYLDYGLDQKELGRELRVAVDEGHEAMLAELATQAPDLITEDELHRMRSSPQDSPWNLRRVLMARQHYEEVVELMRAELEDSGYPAGLLQDVRDLYRAGRRPLARSLHQGILHHIDRLGTGAELSNWTKLELLILDEFAELGDALPEPVLVATLDGLADGNPANFGGEVQVWARTHKKAAKQFEQIAKTRAPSIHSWFAAALTDGKAGTGPWRFWHVIVAIALLAALRVIAGQGCGPSPTEAGHGGPAPAAVRRATDVLCAQSQVFCAEARPLAVALNGLDCRAARSHMEALGAAVGAAQDQRLDEVAAEEPSLAPATLEVWDQARPHLGTFRRALAVTCPTP